MSLDESSLYCAGCGKPPDQIDEYVAEAEHLDMAPAEYVMKEEFTLNTRNGHFLCTDCYIKAGMPTSPRGWVAP